MSTAAEMVRREIGFEVILLDSKLFPILNMIDFWKSTRKVIAASRSTYESLVGVTAGEELKQVEDNAIEVPPSKKAKVNDDLLMELNHKVDEILVKLSFIDDVKKVFECIICKSSSCNLCCVCLLSASVRLQVLCGQMEFNQSKMPTLFNHWKDSGLF